MREITVFKNAREIAVPYYVDVNVVLQRIKTCHSQNQINKIRQESDDKKKKALKRALPSIIFAGKFSKREDKAMLSHSGLCVLDFDHLKDVVARKEELKQHSFFYSIFVSPSGDGLKAIAKIPPIIEQHRGHYKGLLEIFPELDTTSINESRVCFESCDKDIYINQDAIDFTDYVDFEEEAKHVEYPNYDTSEIVKTGTDYYKIAIATKMIAEATDGEKHKTLLRASKLMGGYIGGGIVDEQDGIRALESEISRKDIDDFEGAQKTIRDGISYGKKNPIFNTEEFKQYHYTPKPAQEKEVKAAKKETETSVILLDDVFAEMKHGFIHGKARGKTTYFGNLDTHYTWKRGELTLITGRPGAGKSEFILQLMLMRSIRDKEKWGVFSPEGMPPEEFYDGLVHTYIGKPVDPYFKNNRASETEYDRASEFIKNHFFLVYPEGEQSMEILVYNFEYLIDKYGIDGTLIDPFNQVDHDMGQRDDQFLSKILKKRKMFALKHNTYELITAHPKLMKKNDSGGYDAPDMYDVSGGAMWGNKIDNMISLLRPQQTTDPTGTNVEIHIKKVKKQKLVGVPGWVEMDFDRTKNRFYLNGKSPLDESLEVQMRINPNLFIEPQKPEEECPF